MAKVNSTVVLRDPGSFAIVVLRAGDEVPEWASVGDHLTSAPEPAPAKPADVAKPAEPVEAAAPGPDKSWTSGQIKQYAEDNGIDLGEATTKAAMLAVIDGDN